MSIGGQGHPLDSVKCPSGSRLCYFNGTGSTICPSDSLMSDFRVLLFNFFLSLKVLRILRPTGMRSMGGSETCDSPLMGETARHVHRPKHLI